MGAISPTLRATILSPADAYSDAAERSRYYAALQKRDASADGMERLGGHRALLRVAKLFDSEADELRRHQERWPY